MNAREPATGDLVGVLGHRPLRAVPHYPAQWTEHPHLSAAVSGDGNQ